MKPMSKPATKKPKRTNKTRKLTVRQETFCELVASGESGTEAWLKAGYKVSRGVARRNASEALTYPDVKARIDELRKPAKEERLRKKEDNLRFLADLIGIDPNDIGDKTHLINEITEDIIAGGNRGKLKRGNAPSGNETVGDTVIRRRVKLPCKLRAIEIYSKLLGHFEPDRVEVEAGPKTLLSIKERAEQIREDMRRRYGNI